MLSRHPQGTPKRGMCGRIRCIDLDRVSGMVERERDVHRSKIRAEQGNFIQVG
jgi:hypothetical protein